MGKFKVLVVDDEKDFLETTIKRIKRSGIDCEGAENGKEAIEKVRTGNFDVVLLDVRMPDLDGIETLGLMKTIKPLLEVVMLTGHASVESGVEGMRLGAFDYLLKPIELDPLLEKLSDAYERKVIQEEKIQKALDAKG